MTPLDSPAAHVRTYPTRALEFTMACAMFVWSVQIVIAPGVMMRGPVFEPLVVIAPDYVWGLAGVLVSGSRIGALILNGAYRPGPVNRMIGAGAGFVFWFGLFCFYTAAVWGGAPHFPMRMTFWVFIVAEGYCALSCAEERSWLRKTSAAPARADDP